MPIDEYEVSYPTSRTLCVSQDERRVLTPFARGDCYCWVLDEDGTHCSLHPEEDCPIHGEAQEGNYAR